MNIEQIKEILVKLMVQKEQTQAALKKYSIVDSYSLSLINKAITK